MYLLKGEKKQLTSNEMVDYMKNLIEKFGIISVEDPLDENDWSSWSEITSRCSGTQIVGDDIFVTQSDLLRKGIEEKAGNAILIKLYQDSIACFLFDPFAQKITLSYKNIISNNLSTRTS